MPRTGLCIYTEQPMPGAGECSGKVSLYPCGERCEAHRPRQEKK